MYVYTHIQTNYQMPPGSAHQGIITDLYDQLLTIDQSDYRISLSHTLIGFNLPFFLQKKTQYWEFQYTSSSGDRVHGTTNVVEYSVVGPKVGDRNCV